MKKVYKEKDFDFSKYKAFFAFSDQQAKESIQKFGGKMKDYCNMGGGLVCHKETAKELTKELPKHHEEERQRRLKIEGLQSIIKYELANYESYYTGDISDAMEVLKDYGATEEQVKKVYSQVLAAS